MLNISKDTPKTISGVLTDSIGFYEPI